MKHSLLAQLVQAALSSGALGTEAFVKALSAQMTQRGIVLAKQAENAKEEQPDGSVLEVSPEEQGVCGCGVRVYHEPVFKE